MKFVALTVALLLALDVNAIRIDQTTFTNIKTRSHNKGDNIEDEIQGALVQEESVSKDFEKQQDIVKK